MTLDEAIKHCEEVAHEQDMKSEFETDNQTYTMSEVEREKCKECAKEHRQLAEWLRELKAYREAEKEIEQELVNWDDIDNGKCRGLFLATSIIQHYKDEEVKANESSETM